MGLLTHGFAMTNALMYHDGLLVERVGATYVSGRWFLGLLGEKGLIGLLCLYAVIRKFRDKRYMDIVWIVLVLVLFPLGLNSIYLAGALWVYDLMMYSMAMLFFVSA